MENEDFIELFISEAKKHLTDIENLLLAIEQGDANKDAIDNLFRHYHSIKGMCASMGYKKMQNFSHHQEDLLDILRNNSLSPSKDHCQTLFECLDILKQMTMLIEVNKTEDNKSFELINTEALIELLKKQSSAIDNTRENTRDYNVEIKQRTETEQAKPKVQHHLRVEGSIFDNMLLSTGDLFAILSTLKKLTKRERSLELRQISHQFEKSLDSLYSEILIARMLPFETVTNNLPRVVRDVAKDRGKNVSLTIKGQDIKLDKTVIEKIGDPLIHIIRNAVDHGIENVSERISADKPPAGSIKILAYSKGQNVVIEITDDGKGIDTEKLKKKALEKGYTQEILNAMSDNEILMLICSPGFSLAQEVTQISGRGVGMDIVKEAIDELNGSLAITSINGIGTRFTIDLPRVVSITDVIVTKCGEELYSIPKTRIEKIIEIETSKCSTDTITYKNNEIKLHNLSSLIGVKNDKVPTYSTVILLNKDAFTKDDPDSAKNIFAIRTDGIEREMEAYIKPLSAPMNRLKLISGVSIIGNDRPVFLLDITELSKSGAIHA